MEEKIALETESESKVEVKTFTQEDVGKIAAKERNEAKAKLLNDLGVESADQLKEIMNSFKEQQEAQKTYEQKYQEAVAEKESILKAMADKEQELGIKMQMMGKGFSEDQISDFIGNVKRAEDPSAEMERLFEQYVKKPVIEESKTIANAGYVGRETEPKNRTANFNLR